MPGIEVFRVATSEVPAAVIYVMVGVYSVGMVVALGCHGIRPLARVLQLTYCTTLAAFDCAVCVDRNQVLRIACKSLPCS